MFVNIDPTSSVGPVSPFIITLVYLQLGFCPKDFDPISEVSVIPRWIRGGAALAFQPLSMSRHPTLQIKQ